MGYILFACGYLEAVGSGYLADSVKVLSTPDFTIFSDRHLAIGAIYMYRIPEPLGQHSAAEPLHWNQTRDAAFLNQSGSLVTELPAPELDVAQLNHLAAR